MPRSLTKALYEKLAGEAGNLFFSPASLRFALSMAYGGARGKTAVEMEAALGFEEKGDKLHQTMAKALARLGESKAKLRAANSFWAQRGYSFTNDYRHLVESLYRAALFELDLNGDPEGARSRINDWVSKRTEGLIPELLGEGSPGGDARLVLINAIYFKAAWAVPFESKATEEAPFYLAGGKERKVATMSKLGSMPYTETETAQILERPYEGSALAMRIILPKDKEGLQRVERDFVGGAFDTKHLRLVPREVDLFLPKFSLEGSFSLEGILAEMGMPTAFTDNADFSAMTGEPRLKISSVVHKAVGKVDEQGTEAAAATSVEMGILECAPEEETPRPVIFRADHPFLFLIRDRETDLNLFAGRLADPGP